MIVEKKTFVKIPNIPDLPSGVMSKEEYGWGMKECDMGDADTYIFTSVGSTGWGGMQYVNNGERILDDLTGSDNLYYVKIWYEDAFKKIKVDDFSKIKKALSLLPEPHKSSAINQISSDHKGVYNITDDTITLGEGVIRFNVWDDLEECGDFWLNVSESIDDDVVDKNLLPKYNKNKNPSI